MNYTYKKEMFASLADLLNKYRQSLTIENKDLSLDDIWSPLIGYSSLQLKLGPTKWAPKRSDMHLNLFITAS